MVNGDAQPQQRGQGEERCEARCCLSLPLATNDITNREHLERDVPFFSVFFAVLGFLGELPQSASLATLAILYVI